jgi:hypothetical protein
VVVAETVLGIVVFPAAAALANPVLWEVVRAVPVGVARDPAALVARRAWGLHAAEVGAAVAAGVAGE